MRTYILSSDDTRFKACCDRLPGCVSGEVERICVTPDTVGSVPDWFSAPVDRWCITMATVKAMQRALECDEDCLYFEDDVVFRDDFEKWYPKLLSALPSNWNQLYLGGQLGIDGEFLPRLCPQSELLMIPSSVHRNHAVLTKKDSLQRCIDWYLAEHGWESKQTCDWRILYLHRREDWNVYIPAMGWLVGQGENFSLLDHKQYPARWWHFTYLEAIEENETV